MKPFAILVLLFNVLLVCTLTSAGSGPTASCCLKASNTVLQREKIASYHIQKDSGVCLFEAVVFTTIRGVRVCSDPRKPWVKKAMKYVDGKNKSTPSYQSTPEMPTSSRCTLDSTK
uniref:C-C motif chemokine n=1 Tax=Lepisosteus oculatus TaxID=7918 RepID=W5MIW2_LEPOC|nr:PREDICTED: monocyte chemotactic protein 1B-like [Lepisosteus oculatus]